MTYSPDCRAVSAYGDDRKECTCSMSFVRRCRNAEGAASSGPLTDRMALCARFTNDIHLVVLRVPFEKLSSLDGGEPSSAVRARVETARTIQAERFAPLGKPHVLVNGDMGPSRRFRAAANQTICSASARWTRPERQFRLLESHASRSSPA